MSVAEQLTAELSKLNESIRILTERVNLAQALVKRQRRQNMIVVGIIVLAFLFGGIQLHRDSDLNTRICHSANRARLGETVLWTNVLNSTPAPAAPGPGATAEQIALYNQELSTRSQFQKDLLNYFAPLNC